jgi:hypothetical protein
MCRIAMVFGLHALETHTANSSLFSFRFNDLERFPKLATSSPEWEAKLSPHTYGFRPGRSCWDAIEAIFLRIRFRPQYALKVGIAKCFDRICHTALLALTQHSCYHPQTDPLWL